MTEPDVPYKTQSESPMKRYFLISGNNSHGDTFDITLISQGVFPSRQKKATGLRIRPRIPLLVLLVSSSSNPKKTTTIL